MTLFELSVQYEDSAAAIRRRIAELREAEHAELDALIALDTPSLADVPLFARRCPIASLAAAAFACAITERTSSGSFALSEDCAAMACACCI